MASRFVLIGGGPAAMTAAESIRGLDPHASITAVCAEPEGYYSRPGLAYLLAKEIPEDWLYPMRPAELAKLGMDLVHDRVVRIDAGQHRVELAGGGTLPYDRLLVATGSLAIPVGVPGADLDGVTKLDDMADVHDLIRRSGHARTAVVVGGGITALEITEGLCERGVHVHYLLRKGRYWGDVLSETESRIVEDGLRARGVEIHPFTRLARIVGESGHVVAVETDSGAQIPCDLVAVAIGVLPQKELAQAAGLECDRGVLVDPYLCSSDPDIFVAGDLAEVRDPAGGRGTIEVLWNAAVAKGRVAGVNMARGSVKPYVSGTPLNITRLAGFKITIIGTVGGGVDTDVQGIVRGDSETWRTQGNGPVIETQAGDAHLRIVLNGHTIAGAVIMGDQGLSYALQDLVCSGADISPIAAALIEPSAPVVNLIDGFWRDWKAHRVQAAS